MSRSWLPDEPNQWRMFSDVCFESDKRTFPTQPDLSLLRAARWSIAQLTDACPTCYQAGETPSNPPHSVMAEVAA